MTKYSVLKINAGIMTACIVGFALSYYAYMVELAKDQDENYQALCDISEHISCSKAFMTKYGKGFGIIPKTSSLYLPNPVYGIIFYALVAVLSIFNNYTVTVASIALGILSNLSTIYLASILYLVKSICIVCVSTYITNAVILVLAVKKYGKLFRKKASKKKAN